VKVEAVDSGDIQLTAVTALLICSKYSDVEPLKLKDCVKSLCFNKYTNYDFINKEIEILDLLKVELDTSHSLDFVIFFMKIIRLKLQAKMNTDESTLDFITHVETLAYDLCKVSLLDVAI
jgi:hypothetical protein